MKKTLLLFCCIILSMGLAAQINIPHGNAPVKLSDVIANYKKLHPDYGQKANPIVKSLLPGYSGPEQEDREKDYQFERWLWYARQHTDGNGYLVSPAKTWAEWQKAKTNEKSHSAERTTSTVLPAWVFQGPDSSEADGWGVGRINVVAFHPTDPNTFWIGSPGGGVWKTTNGGTSWTCLTDQLPLLSISDIIVNPLNPNTIYLCTGDREAGDYEGIGVLKSYDGGTTWNTTGMTWTPSMYNIANSMVINPLDTNSLILGTTAGLYQSFDGGATFTMVNPNNFMQVIYRPGDTTTVYGTTPMNYATTPYTCAQIWLSNDGGTTWNMQTSLTTSNRLTLAVTPAAPDLVLAVSSMYDVTGGGNTDGLDGIYQSTDAGNTYTEIYFGDCSNNLLTWDATGNGCGGQGWYTLPLAISPTDPNIVFTGGVNAWGSSDGGMTWNIVSQWSGQLPGVETIHADKHWMAYNPAAPTVFYETNDGGIYSSSDPTSTGIWNNLTNRMGIEEIYRTSVSDIANFAISGAQDVGSKVTRPFGLFEEANGGDGMACLLDFGDSTVGYASSEMGYFVRLDPTANPPVGTGVDISATIGEGSGGWVTPICAQPGCSSCILIGYSSVFQSTDVGNTWNNLSPALTTGTLYRIATTDADANTIFATENASTQNIYYTHDGGGTWTTMIAPYSGTQFISDLKVDPRDANHIWITYGGYGSPQVAEWKAGAGWAQINAGLPDVPLYCFAIDYQSRDIYVGTELGTYYRDSLMTTWMPYRTGMPSVSVTDLEIKYSTNEIWAATYGRSLWKSPKHTTTTGPLSTMSIAPFVPDGIIISPNPNHGNFTVSVKNIANKQVTMHITDANGKTVWQGNGTLIDSKLNINIQGLVAGNYIFEISTGNTIEGKQKLVIY